jgi:hypothetical protein
MRQASQNRLKRTVAAPDEYPKPCRDSPVPSGKNRRAVVDQAVALPEHVEIEAEKSLPLTDIVEAVRLCGH